MRSVQLQTVDATSGATVTPGGDAEVVAGCVAAPVVAVVVVAAGDVPATGAEVIVAAVVERAAVDVGCPLIRLTRQAQKTTMVVKATVTYSVGIG